MGRRLRILLLLCLFLSCNIESASATTDEVIELNNAGVKALNQGDNAEGIRLFKQAMKLDPDYSLARDNIAIAYAALGHHVKDFPPVALKLYHQALFLQPGNFAFIQNVDESILVLGMDPKSFYDRLELAESAMAENDLESAIDEYLAALRIENNPYVRQRLAAVYKAQGDIDKANEENREAESALKLVHDQPIEVPEADQSALKKPKGPAQGEDPFNVDTHIKAGKEYQRLGHFEQAEKEYTIAIQFSQDKLTSKIEAERLLAALANIRGLKGKTNQNPSLVERLYLQQIKMLLQNSWNPEFKQELSIARVNVVIEGSGKVINSRLTKSSGISGFDSSALNALTKATFPPLPSELALMTVDVSFVTTENGKIIYTTLLRASKKSIP